MNRNQPTRSKSKYGLSDKIPMDNPFGDLDAAVPVSRSASISTTIADDNSPLADIMANLDLLSATSLDEMLEQVRSAKERPFPVPASTPKGSSLKTAPSPVLFNTTAEINLRWIPYGTPCQVTPQLSIKCGGFYVSDYLTRAEGPLTICLNKAVIEESLRQAKLAPNQEPEHSHLLERAALYQEQGIYLGWVMKGKPLSQSPFSCYLGSLIGAHMTSLHHLACQSIRELSAQDVSAMIAELNAMAAVLARLMKQQDLKSNGVFMTPLYQCLHRAKLDLNEVVTLLVLGRPTEISPDQATMVDLRDLTVPHQLHYQVANQQPVSLPLLIEAFISSAQNSKLTELQNANEVIVRYLKARALDLLAPHYPDGLVLPESALTPQRVTPYSGDHYRLLRHFRQLSPSVLLSEVSLNSCLDFQALSPLLTVINGLIDQIYDQFREDAGYRQSAFYSASLLFTRGIPSSMTNEYNLKTALELTDDMPSVILPMHQLCHKIFPELRISNHATFTPISHHQSYVYDANAGAKGLDVTHIMVALMRLAILAGVSISFLSRHDIRELKKETQIVISHGRQLTRQYHRPEVLIYLKALYQLGASFRKKHRSQDQKMLTHLTQVLSNGKTPVLAKELPPLLGYFEFMLLNRVENAFDSQDVAQIKQEQWQPIVRSAFISIIKIFGKNAIPSTIPLAFYQEIGLDEAQFDLDCISRSYQLDGLIQSGCDFDPSAAATQPKSKKARTAATAITPPAPLTLDRDLIATYEQETLQSRKILHAIFEDKGVENKPFESKLPEGLTTPGAELVSAEVDSLADKAVPRTPPQVGVPEQADCVDSLSAALSAVYREIVSKEAWAMAEVQTLCKAQRLMKDAALEAINDWAIELTGAPLLEIGGEVLVDAEIASELPR